MKEKRINKLDISKKAYYKNKIVTGLMERKKEGIKYSKEFIKTVKNIPYENIPENKIRGLCTYSYIILGDVNYINSETEKYYLQLINAIIRTDNNIPLGGIGNVFYNIFQNIQYLYDTLDISLFNKIFNLYCNNISNVKRKVITSIFNIQVLIETETIKANQSFLNNIVDYLIDCNNNDKISCLDTIINNFSKFSDPNLLVSKYKIKILDTIINSSYPYINELLVDLLKYDIKNNKLFTFLLELYSNEDNKYIQNFWIFMIDNRKFMTTTDFEFQNKVIDMSKKINFDEQSFKTEAIVNITKILINLSNTTIRDYIIEKLSEIKNVRSFLLLEKLIPILIEYTNEEEIKNVINNIEIDNNLTKKLIINLDNNKDN